MKKANLCKKLQAECDAKLKTWAGLNSALKSCDEDECSLLLSEEANGKKRIQFMFRIHSRLNKIRADRERKEIRDLMNPW